ncbi:Membrane protein involved in the export of O-antigen and teichoic acid [Maribacter orientalis]|uniref:Membrane protein involved in the export of O-antigen and teichoic acid n=1 Tax=Maribacter orientalis TaxID=228957 RepID=A0A1H7TGF4_9FLAO|nr:flippase [Maribacter orientalis]SEL83930.1 Membrane protein involved in the export of O-antigen and teichoic acid [Maribacter orientalis]
MSFKKSLKAVSFLWLGSILGSGSTFVIYIILAREIGPSSFGIFSSAIATTMIFSLLAGFGVAQSWLKIFGEEGWSGIRWVKPSLYFVVLTLAIITVFLAVFSKLPFQDAVTSRILLVLTLHMYGFIAIELVTSKLQLEEGYVNMTIWKLLPNLLRLISILISVFILGIELDVYKIAFIYAFVGVLSLLISLPHFLKMIEGDFGLKGHGNKKQVQNNIVKISDVLKESWPFGLATLFAFIYVQSDIIMVKYLAGDEQAGYYNVGYVILTAILLIPSILFGKFLLPKYHRWANQDKPKFYKVYKLSNILMLILGILAMLFILIGSETFIILVFGIEYYDSIVLMNILAFCVPISFLTYSFGAVLVTRKHMRLKVVFMGSVAVFNILANLLLIPKFGPKGAALATVGSNILLMALYFWGAKKRVFVKGF